jgi:hypothetical protein
MVDATTEETATENATETATEIAVETATAEPEAKPETNPVDSFRAEVEAKAQELGIDLGETFAPDPKLRRQLAASRQEIKAWARKEREIQRREAQLQAHLQELESARAEVERYRTNPLEALDAAGVPLSNWLNQQHTNQERQNDPVWQELQQIKAQLQEREQQTASQRAEQERTSQVFAVQTFAQERLQASTQAYPTLSAFMANGVRIPVGDTSVSPQEFLNLLASEAVDIYRREKREIDLDEVFEAYEEACLAETQKYQKLTSMVKAPAPRGAPAPALTNEAASDGTGNLAMPGPDDPDEVWDAYQKRKLAAGMYP